MLQFLRMGNKRTKLIWWFLTVTVIGGFLIGFVAIAAFMHEGPKTTGGVGTVNGQVISRADYQSAINEQREAFVRQSGADPDADEERALETQAWHSLVSQRVMGDLARQLGLNGHDREIVLALESSPPQVLLTAPAFQTNGKFDPQKYVSALRDPNNNWSPFEALVRSQLPVRKLQERLVASLKLSEPELREAYRDRFEKVSLTILQIPPSQQPNVATPSEADVARMYESYKGRFASGPRTQVEILQVPMRYSPEEIKSARETAQGLVDRARRGEDFATLARDYSEGPGAAKGGELARVFQPKEFGPGLEASMAALPKGGISDPFQDGPFFVVLKVLDRVADPVSSVPNLRVAQIAIRVRPGEASRQEQYQRVKKVRDRAGRVGLGKAAAENGLATGKSDFFDFSAPPQQLATVPEASDWALGNKPGAVSPVFAEPTEFTVVQVADQRPGGAPAQAEIAEQLRQLAQVETRVNLEKPTADRVSQMVAGGAKLEDVAKSLKLATFKVDTMSRVQPDPRLNVLPEVIGAAFASAAGRTIGPIQTLGGWYFVRVDKHVPADPAAFEPMKAQITQDILTRRQQRFFAAWLTELRARTKVQDYRAELDM
jgi:peptidyl-prolyl cis-trans isomerase D